MIRHPLLSKQFPTTNSRFTVHLEDFTSCMLGIFSCLLSSAVFSLQNLFFSNLSGIQPACQTLCIIDWLRSLTQIFINVSYHILVASLTLMALF